jgi:ankyrin repeat protein
VINRLLEIKIDIIELSNNDITFLHLAAENRYVDIIYRLLQMDAIPTNKLNKGRIFYDATLDKPDTMLWPLSEKETDKEIQNSTIIINNLINENGQTLLHFAAEIGNKAVINLLLIFYLNPNLRDNWGRIPLYLAILARNIFFVHYIIQYSANVNLLDCYK